MGIEVKLISIRLMSEAQFESNPELYLRISQLYSLNERNRKSILGTSCFSFSNLAKTTNSTQINCSSTQK